MFWVGVQSLGLKWLLRLEAGNQTLKAEYLLIICFTRVGYIRIKFQKWYNVKFNDLVYIIDLLNLITLEGRGSYDLKFCLNYYYLL